MNGSGRRLLLSDLAIEFRGKMWDVWNYVLHDSERSDIKINHFIPDDEGKKRKLEWYEKITGLIEQGKKVPPLSSFEHFNTWKRYNPHRAKYR